MFLPIYWSNNEVNWPKIKNLDRKSNIHSFAVDMTVSASTTLYSRALCTPVEGDSWGFSKFGCLMLSFVWYLSLKNIYSKVIDKILHCDISINVHGIKWSTWYDMVVVMISERLKVKFGDSFLLFQVDDEIAIFKVKSLGLSVYNLCFKGILQHKGVECCLWASQCCDCAFRPHVVHRFYFCVFFVGKCVITDSLWCLLALSRCVSYGHDTKLWCGVWAGSIDLFWLIC